MTRINTSESIDLSVGRDVVFDGLEYLNTEGRNNITIQTIGSGTGTATIRFSNDLDSDFLDYDELSTEYDISKAIDIKQFNYLFMNIFVHSGGTGTVKFKVVQQ